MKEAILTDIQKMVFEQCLNAVVNGPFIPDSEFHTLFGLERNEVKEILEHWPEVLLNNSTIQIAINNTLNNLLGYPIDSPEQWDEFIPITKKDLKEMFDEWRKNTGQIINEDAKAYFDSLE